MNCSKVDRFRASWMLCSLHQLRLLRGNKQGKLLSHKCRRTARHGVEEDADPGDMPHVTGNQPPTNPPVQRKDTAASIPGGKPRYNHRRPTPTEYRYGRDNPRRSERLRQKLGQGRDATDNPQLVGRLYGVHQMVPSRTFYLEHCHNF